MPHGLNYANGCRRGTIAWEARGLLNARGDCCLLSALCLSLSAPQFLNSLSYRTNTAFPESSAGPRSPTLFLTASTTTQRLRETRAAAKGARRAAAKGARLHFMVSAMV